MPPAGGGAVFGMWRRRGGVRLQAWRLGALFRVASRLRHTSGMPIYEYPRPAVTADVAVFREASAGLEVLLVRRGNDPYRGAWALPGGFVDQDEPLEAAARRELAEETGVEDPGPLVEVGAYGDPGRDPRGWTVTVLYAAGPVPAGTHARAGDDAAEVGWHAASSPPPLAFDHRVLLADALERVVRRAV